MNYLSLLTLWPIGCIYFFIYYADMFKCSCKIQCYNRLPNIWLLYINEMSLPWLQAPTSNLYYQNTERFNVLSCHSVCVSHRAMRNSLGCSETEWERLWSQIHTEINDLHTFVLHNLHFFITFLLTFQM